MSDVVEEAKPPRMLIADDDPSVLNLLVEVCSKMGFDVDSAANGMQSLIKARQTRPDIMILDVNMPELDGLAVCSHLLGPGSKTPEVLVVTGRSDEETIERCESFGAYYGRKGPDFWKDIETALIEIYPHLTNRIKEQTARPKTSKVHDRPRVLIVDDDPIVETFFASRLAKFGVNMLYASDATQGYRIAVRERPSVIIADYFMPNGDANYLILRLRSTAATANIPVFVLSGQELDDTTKLKLRREVRGHPGAAHIFTKSFEVTELFAALQKHCSFDTMPRKAQAGMPAAAP